MTGRVCYRGVSPAATPVVGKQLTAGAAATLVNAADLVYAVEQGLLAAVFKGSEKTGPKGWKVKLEARHVSKSRCRP